MTEPTDQEQYLNIADQCATTATNDLAASILVDGGSGTLRELLNDAADAIRAGCAAPQPTRAQAGAEQRQMDAKHAAIYRWMLSNVAEAWNIIDNWCLDAEAGTDELHDALAARAKAKEGGA